MKASDLTYLPANKAYLSVPAGTADVLGVMSYNDYVTGIKDVTVDKKTAASGIYTLDGKKVNKISKRGVYVVEGKKVVKK